MEIVATDTSRANTEIFDVFDEFDARLAVHSPVFDAWGDVADAKLVWSNRAWRESPVRNGARDALIAHIAEAWLRGRSSGLVHSDADPAGSWVTWNRVRQHVVENSFSAAADAWPTWFDGAGRAPMLVARRAVSLEKARMARGLHDLGIQRLYASRLRLSVLESRVDDDTRAEINELAASIDAVISDVRDQILQSGDSSPVGLRYRLEESLAAVLPAHGCDLDLDVDDELRVSDRVWANARAVIMEAASNALRHGGASMFWVSVDKRGPLVVFSVADNGSGVGVPSHNGHRTPGNGMKNMENRAHLLGGTFRVTPRDAGGTVVEWAVPAEGGP
ncbi:MAG: sensor histidine kinase [Ilumatobacteraceae bacterium]